MLRSDALFVNGSGGEVRRIMRVRRRHGECKGGGGGCEVVLGGSCGGERRVRGKGWRWEGVGMGGWGVVVAVMGVVGGLLGYGVLLWGVRVGVEGELEGRREV